MNEHDLTRHLVGHAADVTPTADAEGLRKSMLRVDRSRRMRGVGAAGSMVAIVTFGFLSLGGSNQASSDLDVRGEVPAPVPSDPDLIPGVVEHPPDDQDGDLVDEPTDEQADEQAADLAYVDSGSDPALASDPPIHLQPASTTTVAAIVVSTTVPTTTTAAPPSPPPTTAAAPATFSASPRYGSCEEDPPYDEYSGIATPGATITITSPYSSTAQTVADGSGNWFLRVEFPTSPVGSPFTVSASDGSTSVGMNFVRLG
jgi:hypothetical protein